MSADEFKWAEWKRKFLMDKDEKEKALLESFEEWKKKNGVDLASSEYISGTFTYTPPPLPDFSVPPLYYGLAPTYITPSPMGASLFVRESERSLLVEKLRHPSFIQWEGRPAFEGTAKISWITTRIETTAVSLDGSIFNVERVKSDRVDEYVSSCGAVRKTQILLKTDFFWVLSFVVSEYVAHSIRSTPVSIWVHLFGPYPTLGEAICIFRRCGRETK